jgi:drug/metabolite transporter (DMT)-like permease
MAAKKGNHGSGIQAGLVSALFLGLLPIFGKQSISTGFSPLSVVALRTCLAAGLLLLIVAVFRRSYLYIYPAGLIGCGLAGFINGAGSLLYYLALGRLDVSIGQLLYSLYPVFLVLWLIADHHHPSWLTYLRIGSALLGVILLTSFTSIHIDWIGVVLMLGASAMYAIHLPINQRVLYDIPAPTVTLYTLLAMSIVVVPVYIIFDRQLPIAGTSWTPIILLTLATFFSRLTLFSGVKKLGGLQTALLGLGELLVSVSIGVIWFHDKLVPTQWIGAAFLGMSLFLIGFERLKPEPRRSKGMLSWLRPPDMTPLDPLGPRE